ncbi:hypothetical protein SO802_005363 [Lithocarpus litseifolius]|uniref:Malectin-like domain-containing protein n=1 Tax=Lithocarpus litseifolius TaxID=425828 RepID=A0AAW2DM72_9ROSI
MKFPVSTSSSQSFFRVLAKLLCTYACFLGLLVSYNGTMTTKDGSYSVIYVPLTDYIDVCLVNTGNGIPFISALELRLLDNSIYHTAGGALTNPMRYDIGSDQSGVR